MHLSAERKKEPDDFINEDFIYDHDAGKSTTSIHRKKGAGAKKK